MFLKILAVLVVLIAALSIVRIRRPAARRRLRRLAKPRAHDLVKCPHCGTWLPAGQVCACEAGDTVRQSPAKRREE